MNKQLQRQKDITIGRFNQFTDLEVNFPNEEDLKKDKEGTYTETKKEQDGYLHTFIVYKSKDGKIQYSRLELKPI